MQRSCPKVSYKDLANRALVEICAEILPRGLLQRSCQETSYGDLHRDLVKGTGILRGDLI